MYAWTMQITSKGGPPVPDASVLSGIEMKFS